MRIICVVVAVAVLSACKPIRDRWPVAPPEPPGVTGHVDPSEPAHPSAKPPVEVAARPESPAEPANNVAAPNLGTIAEWNGKLMDIYFAYDQSTLSPEAGAALESDAKIVTAVLADFPGVRLILEGHCDERGSAEYNLALGDRRADRTAQALRGMGISRAAIRTISYGKEQPQCTESNESCWSRNRRAHLLFEEERRSTQE